MFAAKVLLKDAERKRQQLLAQSMVDTNFRAHREGDFFYIPLKKKMSGCVEHTFEEKKEKNMLENELDTLLSSKEKEMLPRSQEIVGDIMILEIPDELKKKKKKIAEIFLRANKSVRTVVKKKNIHGGTFRTRTVEVLATDSKCRCATCLNRRKITIHRESGCRIKVHIEKMYFSARLAHERLRIAEQVKKKERVLVMFSGCSPYVCVIAKKSGADVTGIEINKIAHEYALENIRMNKVKADLYCGDVKKVLPKLKKKFNRIVMPLPKTGEEFLPIALKNTEKNGIIHYYAFLRDEEVVNYKKKIKLICTNAGKKCRIVRVVHAGQNAPYIFRMCFDVKVV